MNDDWAAVLKVLSIIFLLTTGVALACLTVYPTDHFGDMASETAIIAWDEDSRTQHFIRRASFRTKAPSVGFVVPTPTVPEFGEVDDGIFGFLNRQCRPRVAYQYGVRFDSIFSNFACSAAKMEKGSGVVVLDYLQVAGYKVAVLKAEDPESLESWLVENG